MLNDLFEIGFHEIMPDRNSGIRTFRLYELYQKIQYRVIVTLENGLFEIQHIFFYSGDRNKLCKELFGDQPAVSEMITKIRALQEQFGSFSNDPETG